MTISEFSSEFDVLYNNIMSNQAPGIDEYEKSVFLTKAQNELIKNYFNSKGNKYQEGFDDNTKRQVDFSNIISTKDLKEKSTGSIVRINANSKIYEFPEDAMMILNESIYIKSKSANLIIVPISYEEYSRLMSRPYKYPLKYQAWRLISGSSYTTGGSYSEIILPSQYSLINGSDIKYSCRYVKHPKPIILTNIDVDYGVSIEGYSEAMTCELDENVHQEILQRAVELAKSAYLGDVNSAVELGKRSE